jgi:lysophospholipase L1-like esterase
VSKRLLTILFVLLAVLLLAPAIAVIASTTSKAPAAKNRLVYAAMGDSVASGAGLQNASDSSACNRSLDSYPYLLAKKLRFELTDLTCSGASIESGIEGRQSVNRLALAPQINRLPANPDIITLTVGANDIHWTRFTKCYTGTCGSDDDNIMLQKDVTAFKDRLHNLLMTLDRTYGSSTHIYVTGYFQLFPKNVQVDCQELQGITQPELNWMRGIQTDLNDTIQNAAHGIKNTTFVPINYAGHELCTGESWLQGADDNVPYHPNKKGEIIFTQAIEKAVAAQQ